MYVFTEELFALLNNNNKNYIKYNLSSLLYREKKTMLLNDSPAPFSVIKLQEHSLQFCYALAFSVFFCLFIFCLLFLSHRGSSKLEEACDLYVRAANMYKMAKNWCGKLFLPFFFNSFMFVDVFTPLLCNLIPQLQETLSPKLLISTCRCRANTMQRPTS